MPLEPQYLVLVCDEESNVWTIVHNSSDRVAAHTELDALEAKDTPSFIINTGDFITFPRKGI